MSKWFIESSCPWQEGLVSMCNGQCKRGLPCEYDDDEEDEEEDE